jgi:hypothetical protein
MTVVQDRSKAATKTDALAIGQSSLVFTSNAKGLSPRAAEISLAQEFVDCPKQVESLSLGFNRSISTVQSRGRSVNVLT